MPGFAAQGKEEVNHKKDKGKGEWVGVEVQRAIVDFFGKVVTVDFDGVHTSGKLLDLSVDLGGDTGEVETIGGIGEFIEGAMIGGGF